MNMSSVPIHNAYNIDIIVQRITTYDRLRCYILKSNTNYCSGRLNIL